MLKFAAFICFCPHLCGVLTAHPVLEHSIQVTLHFHVFKFSLVSLLCVQDAYYVRVCPCGTPASENVLRRIGVLLKPFEYQFYVMPAYVHPP
ncbi:hypothetical protein BD779DRAFT_1568949 [Infundibulicybe gibba]|nr:hypothetical protein BD779DRAFT_1568949 [Infundibulicybe gibba]